jgi:hypothetical protein
MESRFASDVPLSFEARFTRAVSVELTTNKSELKLNHVRTFLRSVELSSGATSSEIELNQVLSSWSRCRRAKFSLRETSANGFKYLVDVCQALV